MIEVRLFPHSTRPGVGLKPREDSLRPLLPLHSRHCPVLEAGSGLGLLVYPALEENEAFEVEFQGDGRYLFTFHMGSRGTQWQPIFRVTVSLPLGVSERSRKTWNSSCEIRRYLPTRPGP